MKAWIPGFYGGRGPLFFLQSKEDSMKRKDVKMLLAGLGVAGLVATGGLSTPAAQAGSG